MDFVDHDEGNVANPGDTPDAVAPARDGVEFFGSGENDVSATNEGSVELAAGMGVARHLGHVEVEVAEAIAPGGGLFLDQGPHGGHVDGFLGADFAVEGETIAGE